MNKELVLQQRIRSLENELAEITADKDLFVHRWQTVRVILTDMEIEKTEFKKEIKKIKKINYILIAIIVFFIWLIVIPYIIG